MTGPGATIHRRAPLRACAQVACHDCGMYRLCAPLGLERGDFSLLDTVLRRKLIYRRGELLYRAGAPLEYLFAIRGGSVKTYLPAGNGRVQVTGFHFAGEVLGLNAIDGHRHPSEAQALETTSVCALSIERFEQLARREPAIQREVIKIMSADIRRHQELLLLLGKRNAEERLAAYLLSLSRRLAERRYSATEFNLSMSRGDIGSYLGIAEETVCRVLARFQEEGVLATRRRYVRLLDLGRLRAIARDLGARPG
ncbi:MAG TPA: fumarate/nitrate reduction transcriptional regulator Fnr [Burkholderiales bacterium]|nr:fumarate/nitrate reduction transcriptional regulator Fnr [Burkholderiales bacterium]